MSTPLPKGITLATLARRLPNMDIEGILGDTPVLLFRPRDDETPVYNTPEDGSSVPVPGGATNVFNWKEDSPAKGASLNEAVVVPLTPTHRNLLEDQVLVGRASSNDIRLVSAQVSKVHVRFVLDEGAWKLVDQGSSNGTRLNGLDLEPNHPYSLRPGDEIVIGDLTALYLDGEGLVQACALV